MPPTRPFQPYYLVHDGLAIYRVGRGEPVLLMPAPHRFERPGLRAAYALIDGLAGQDRRVITRSARSGRSGWPAQLSMAEMHQCTDGHIAVERFRELADAFPLGSFPGSGIIHYL